MEGFTFWKSYFEVMADTDAETVKALLVAMGEYMFYDIAPEPGSMDKTAELLFKAFKGNLDKSKAKSAARRKKTDEAAPAAFGDMQAVTNEIEAEQSGTSDNIAEKCCNTKNKEQKTKNEKQKTKNKDEKQNTNSKDKDDDKGEKQAVARLRLLGPDEEPAPNAWTGPPGYAPMPPGEWNRRRNELTAALMAERS